MQTTTEKGRPGRKQKRYLITHFMQAFLPNVTKHWIISDTSPEKLMNNDMIFMDYLYVIRRMSLSLTIKIKYAN